MNLQILVPDPLNYSARIPQALIGQVGSATAEVSPDGIFLIGSKVSL